MRKGATVFLAVLLLAAAAAARKDEPLDQILKRADAASPSEKVSLYTEAAERQLDSAEQLYQAGNAEAGRAAIGDVVTYSTKACDAANSSGSKLKRTEISIRKMAAKLRDIKRTLDFENQKPVQDAADQLETLRTGLLTRMFGKSKK
jgi:hypothetical protein